MRLRKNIANIISGGAVVRAQQTRIALRQAVRRERHEKAMVQARYEAAYWNYFRSYLPGFIQSAREDENALARQEILRRTRYFEKNSGVLGKVLHLLDVNVVGQGITPAPSTSDAEWNKRALEWWLDWSEKADRAEENSYPKLQQLAQRAECVDGDAFLRLTTNFAGRPAVELIEGHRVGAGGPSIQGFIDAGYKVVDGVVVEPTFKRAIAYLVQDDFDQTKVDTIPASQVVKHFNRHRVGTYRGISIMHAAILDLHDKDDLQKFEMLAAKTASSKAMIVETPQGGVTAADTFGAPLVPGVNSDPTQRQQMLRQANGGEWLVLNPGEKINQMESKRPSAAMTGFWGLLDEKVMQGVGISYAALVDYKGNWGGATLRAALQSDNRTYQLRTKEQSRCAQRVWEYAIGWAISRGELPPNPEFRNVRWHPPRRTTVDVGNDSDAMLNELKAGVRTYRDVLGEIGEDWKDILEQRAQEEAFLQALAKKYDIPKADIASFAQERLAGQAPDAVGPQPGMPGEPGQQQTPNKGGKGQNA